MSRALYIDPVLVRRDFDYDRMTGVIRSKETGDIVGSPSNGYLAVRWRGHNFYLHRLAWVWMTGQQPVAQIDHKNRKKPDNRWLNLREATQTQNRYNSGAHRNRAAGLKGISYDPARKKWLARIAIDGKQVNLGRREKVKDSHALYAAAADRIAGEFARVA